MAVRRIFSPGGQEGLYAEKVPNIQRIINNDILKIASIVSSGGGGSLKSHDTGHKLLFKLLFRPYAEQCIL